MRSNKNYDIRKLNKQQEQKKHIRSENKYARAIDILEKKR